VTKTVLKDQSGQFQQPLEKIVLKIVIKMVHTWPVGMGRVTVKVTTNMTGLVVIGLWKVLCRERSGPLTKWQSLVMKLMLLKIFMT
jgi:hypothetical protein